MKSVWSAETQLPEFSKLNNNRKTDVLIIGGGIAGIITAFFLHQQGIDYILVEKERICSGNTQNTTAKITSQHGLIYHKLVKIFGHEKAKIYLDANQLALNKYAELCNNIDCDFERKDNYVYSTDNREKIEKELDALSKIGFNAELCNITALPLETLGAVKFGNQAQFNPLKFISAISNGLNIYENTFVREMIDNTAITDRGSIKAEKVIVATHFPFINKHGSYFAKLYQHRSYAIAFENADDVKGMYVDESETGMSFRNYGELLIVGGGDHRTGKNGGNWREIRNFASKNYPHAKEKYFWSAQDCMSLDGMPYIGRYSKKTSDLFVATGFNKWGMTGAMVSAMLLCDELLGMKNELTELFDPSRSVLKPQLLINGFETVANMLSFSEKRCPHLGCALKWNSAERSWDCPCHGSRFDCDGKVLDNPANGDLKKR